MGRVYNVHVLQIIVLTASSVAEKLPGLFKADKEKVYFSVLLLIVIV